MWASSPGCRAACPPAAAIVSWAPVWLRAGAGGQGDCGNGLEDSGRLASPLHQLLIKGIPGMTEPCVLGGRPSMRDTHPTQAPPTTAPRSWDWVHGGTANPCHLQSPEIRLPGFQGDRLGVGEGGSLAPSCGHPGP